MKKISEYSDEELCDDYKMITMCDDDNFCCKDDVFDEVSKRISSNIYDTEVLRGMVRQCITASELKYTNCGNYGPMEFLYRITEKGIVAMDRDFARDIMIAALTKVAENS